MGEPYTPPEALESKAAATKKETKAKQYTHDQSPEDLEVSEGEEIDKIKARYAKPVDLAEGSAQESYKELAKTEDLEEAKRGMKFLYSKFEGQILMNRELIKKLENEIKEKYQILKERKA